jgi:hypothetical protein
VLNHTTTKLGVANYFHLIEFSFRDDKGAGEQSLAFHSTSEDFILQGNKRFVLKPGTRLKVYYDPQGSFEPQLFDDPRGAVWGGLARLGVVAAFFAGIVVVVIYVSLTYRPRLRVPHDAKFRMPKELTIPPNSPVINQ